MIFQGCGIVLKDDRLIAVFQHGQYQTDDQAEIKTLLALGYVGQETESIAAKDETMPIESWAYRNMTVARLKKACQARGLQGYDKLKKDELVALLGGE